ncbi:hypothetical protein HC256_004375 [Beauveria bassiana]|nr:hypothetical protein HC256_004375 [Beauveria bassiana]
MDTIVKFIDGESSHVEFPAQGQQRRLQVQSQGLSCGNDLIGHARVWAFAQRLAHWVILVHTFMRTFERLVQHLYDNRATEGHAIRQLVAQFAACAAEDITTLSGWHELLRQFPAFAIDFAREVTRRLAEPKTCAKEKMETDARGAL